LYLVAAATDKKEDRRFTTQVELIGERLDRLATALGEGAASLKQAWEAWERLSNLIQRAGGEKLPSLIQTTRILPEYRHLKKLRQNQNAGRDGESDA